MEVDPEPHPHTIEMFDLSRDPREKNNRFSTSHPAGRRLKNGWRDSLMEEQPDQPTLEQLTKAITALLLPPTSP